MTEEFQAPQRTTPEELMAMIQRFNEITAGFQQAYDLLQARVAELTRELEEKNLELQRKKRLEAIGQMAAGVAHEIRNPLGGIQLYSGMLERDLAFDPEKLRVVRKISEGVRHLNSIVEDLLAYTHGSVPSLRECVLEAVVRDALVMAEPEREKRGIALERGFAGENNRIMGDDESLKRAFLNVVLNAYQFMPQGGRFSVSVERVEGRQGRPEACLRFADTGPGIAEENLEKIFQPFFTRREGGTGLGLAIVHRIIVEIHGGRIAATNRPGGGAEFVVHLPVGE